LYVNIGGFIPGDKYNKALFANPGAKGNWISLKLVGEKSNRAAIGAKITLRVTDSAGRQSLRYREVTSGGSFGASPLTQQIGLGAGLKNGKIDSIEIWWPASRSRQTFRDIAANQFLEIRESATEYQTMPRQAFSLSSQKRAGLQANGPLPRR
jgi:hypothetical protein